MAKRKILALALALSMVAILAIGGTLAYFVDSESATNVFTVGDVTIDLIEKYEPNSQLMPGTKTQNAVNKDVWVKNTSDKNSAWIRVKVEVPAHLDVLTVEPEDYEVIAAKNILHWNFTAGNEEIWNVEKACWEAVLSADKKYNVYTFYYNEIVRAGETTKQLLEQVYLDAKVDHNGETYTFKGEPVDLSNIDIKVTAEAIQADGFDTFEAAFAAYDAQMAAK